MKYLLWLGLLSTQLLFGQEPRLVGEKIFNYSLFKENGKIGLAYVGGRKVPDNEFDYIIELPATFDTIIEDFDLFKCYNGEIFKLYDADFKEFHFVDYDLTWLGTFKQKHFYATEIRTEKGRGILDDSQRKILVPPEYDNIKFIDNFGSELLFKAEKNGVGFLYLDSILVDNLLVDKVKRIDESLFLKVTNKDKVGLYLIHSNREAVNYERQVTEILPVNFSKIEIELSEVGGDYLISGDKQTGLFFWEGSETGWLIPMGYEKIDLEKRREISMWKYIVPVKDLSGKEGYLFYEATYRPIQPVFMKDFKVAEGGYLLFQHENGKWGVIETSFGSVAIIVPPEYDQILMGDEIGRLSDHGVAVVRKGNKWGAINMINVIRAEIKYDKPSDIVLDY